MNREEYIKVKCSRPNKTENMKIVSQPKSEKLISKCTDYEIPEKMKQLHLTLKEEVGKTTYMKSYCWNQNKNGGPSKTSFRNVQYVKSDDDEKKFLLYGMDNRPPNPSQIPSSEFQDKYLNISEQKFKSKNTDLSSKVYCKVRNPCKDQQPVMKTVSKGFSKYLDPYISTTHFDFYEIPLKELDKFKSKQHQYGLRKRITPVYDESFLRLKYHEKILPKIINPVPHTGMESEMKSSYRLNFDEVKLRNYKNIVIPPMTRETKAEIMFTPSVYQTEYNRLGINHNLSPPIR